MKAFGTSWIRLDPSQEARGRAGGSARQLGRFRSRAAAVIRKAALRQGRFRWHGPHA
jgi:hypothetical protein